MSCRTLLKSGRYLVPVRKILIRVFYTFGQYHSLGNLPLCVLDPNKVEYANIIHLLKHLHLIESPNDLDKLCHLDGPRIVLKSSFSLHFRPHSLWILFNINFIRPNKRNTHLQTHHEKLWLIAGFTWQRFFSTLSYILKAHRSFSSGVPDAVMSVASMNSWQRRIFILFFILIQIYISICGQHELLRMSPKHLLWWSRFEGP